MISSPDRAIVVHMQVQQCVANILFLFGLLKIDCWWWFVARENTVFARKTGALLFFLDRLYYMRLVYFNAHLMVRAVRVNGTMLAYKDQGGAKGTPKASCPSTVCRMMLCKNTNFMLRRRRVVSRQINAQIVPNGTCNPTHGAVMFYLFCARARTTPPVDVSPWIESPLVWVHDETDAQNCEDLVARLRETY